MPQLDTDPQDADGRLTPREGVSGLKPRAPPPAGAIKKPPAHADGRKETGMNRWRRFCDRMRPGHPPLWAWCITWAIQLLVIGLFLTSMVVVMLRG